MRGKPSRRPPVMRNAAATALLTVALGACGSQTTTGQGAATGGAGGVASNGGTRGWGGATGSGGGSGVAGNPGRGGISTTGGAMAGAMTGGGPSASGGSAGNGGTAGTGGTLSGGVLGSGGLAGTGGATGRGGSGARGGATGRGGAGGSTAPSDAGASRDATPPDDLQNGTRDSAGDVPVAQSDSADTRPLACPATSTLKAGDNRATLQFGGRNRSYLVYLPSSVKAGVAVPLVFDFHGHGGSATQEESSSGWKQKADKVGFLVAYPEGVDTSWNVGSCCGLAMSENVDDVGFTRAMIEAIGKVACIDPKRIYATGMSNGAGFVHRLACEAADVIAAIAAASADLVTDPCTPARPISELSVRGLSDTMVAYDGGKTGSTGWYSPGAKGTLDLWKKIDGCTGVTQTILQYCETYTSCSAGVEITLCSLPNTGHDTYKNAVGMSVPDVAWEMFQRQPMP